MSGGVVAPPAVSHGDRLPALLAYIEDKATGDGHARRARVRVAARFPPTGPFPTREAVDQAITDTAPTEEASPWLD